MTLYLVKEAWTEELDIEGPEEELIEHYVKHLERLKNLSETTPAGVFGQLKDLLSKDTRKYDRCCLFAQAYHIGLIKRGILPPPQKKTDYNEYFNHKKEELAKSVRVKNNGANVVISSWGDKSFRVLPFRIELGDSESEPYPLDFMMFGPMIKEQAVLYGWHFSSGALFPITKDTNTTPVRTPAIQTPSIQTPSVRTPSIQTPANQTPAQWTFIEKAFGKSLTEKEQLEIKIALIAFAIGFIAVPFFFL